MIVLRKISASKEDEIRQRPKVLFNEEFDD